MKGDNKMDKRKVLYELSERTADPFESSYCLRLMDSIENDTHMGKIIIQLLEYAENGNFK